MSLVDTFYGLSEIAKAKYWRVDSGEYHWHNPTSDKVEVFNPSAAAGPHEEVPQDKAAAKLWRERGTDSPFFKKWFGDSSVVDDNGNPKVVYHGTGSVSKTPSRMRTRNKKDVDAARKALTKIADKFKLEPLDAAHILERWQNSGILGEMGVTPELVSTARDLTERIKRGVEHVPSKTRIGFDEFTLPSGELELGSHFGSKSQASVLASGGGDVFPFYLSIRNPLRLPDLGTWNYQSVMREARARGVSISTEEYEKVFNARDNNAALRELLESKGFDGVVYQNEAEGKGASYIAFRPEQIKSARENKGTFDPRSRKINE